MKKLFFLACILTLAVMLGAGSAVAETKTIVIATDATWPPMEYVDANKELVGFSVDYMKAAAKEGGYEVQIINADWKGIFVGLLNGQYDAVCSSVTITEDRKKEMSFTTPYFTVRQAVIVPKDSELKTMEDLAGKTAGSQNSTTGTFAIEKVEGAISRPYNEVGLAVADLYNGRIDAVVCDDAVASNFIMTNDKYKEALKIALVLDASEAQEQYGVAVRPDSPEILALLNKGIEAVKAKGIDQELIKKWIMAE